MRASAMVKIHSRSQALPGYFLLAIVPADHDRPAEIEKRAIVEWGYEEDDEFSIPYPITLGGVVAEDIFVLRPDGAVEDVEGLRFDSLEQYRQALRDGDE